MLLRVLGFSLALSLYTMSYMSVAYAQDLPLPEILDFIGHAIHVLGGLKGASAWVIAGVVVELVIKFFNAKFFDHFFSKLKGHIKLTIVLSLSYISGVISLVAIGEHSFGSALVHSASLSAFLVLVNQIYKQYFQKND